MKKIVFAIALVFLFTVDTNAAFNDVSNGDLYDDAINYIEDRNIVNGYSDGSYRSGNLITRGEFTKIVINAKYSSSEIRDCVSDSRLIRIYYDVFSNNKFVDYICIAKEKNIIEGYSDGYFRPDEYITLGEASKILAETYNLSGSRIELRSYAEVLIEKRYIPSQLRALNEYVTRGQMAEMIYRIEENIRNREALKETALYDQIISMGFEDYDSRNAEIEGVIIDRLNYSVFKNSYGARIKLDINKKTADDFIDELEDLDGDDVNVVVYILDDEVKFGYIY
ncbi:S-layer homology domain-containing protein [Candidatus Dojkabacteria bacterium]|nr:S-layer homology domain-containing protein [Candidatus Dojkabacteria bacterium]